MGIWSAFQLIIMKMREVELKYDKKVNILFQPCI